jgi:antitoxin component of RelBE/YafQ-DinJ toxin-antitoxin module
MTAAWKNDHSPINYEKMVVYVDEKHKEALKQYTAQMGINPTQVLRLLLQKFLRGEIELNFSPPVKIENNTWRKS